MKRFLEMFAVALFVIGAAPSSYAGDVALTPLPIPTGPGDTEVFMLDNNGSWVSQGGVGDPTNLARLNRFGDIIDSNCNKRLWEINVRITASIAQWIDWQLTAQGWVWRVKKPGCYAGNSIEFVVASNGDILIDYENFNDLHSVQGNAHVENIETYYSWGAGIADAETNGWVRAADLNFDDDVLLDDVFTGSPLPDLHDGVRFKLWNKICVVESNTACEYHDDATITLVLQMQKDWLDDAGGWI